MLRPIPDKDVSRDRPRSNKIRVLGHVSRTIDFARVVDSLCNLDARGRCSGGWESVPTEFTTFIVVRVSVESIGRVNDGGGRVCVAFREVHGCDLKVVLRLTGRVCTKEETMDCVWLVGWSSLCISMAILEMK